MENAKWKMENAKLMRIKGLPVYDFMKALAHLIRLPNVLIIVLTQLLLRYCIILPFLYPDAPGSIAPLADFLVLVFVTLLIAMGGYVINDYFDVQTDAINRPGRLVVNRVISRHAAIKIHMILNSAAILLGFYLAWQIKVVSFGLVFPLISGVLWIYSAKYKRTLFWGNFIVAGLSAFVVLIVWLFEFFRLRMSPADFTAVLPEIQIVTCLFTAYAVFAFLVSLVREIIKDMEDVEGDETTGCKTLPIVAGMNASRFIAGGLIVLTIMLLGYAQAMLYQSGFSLAFWYLMITVQPGAVYFLIRLLRASNRQDYHVLSTLCKVIMVAGILSMELILISK